MRAVADRGQPAQVGGRAAPGNCGGRTARGPVVPRKLSPNGWASACPLASVALLRGSAACPGGDRRGGGVSILISRAPRDGRCCGLTRGGTTRRGPERGSGTGEAASPLGTERGRTWDASLQHSDIRGARARRAVPMLLRTVPLRLQADGTYHTVLVAGLTIPIRCHF